VLAESPSDAVARADAAFNHGDLDLMLAYYEEDAVMVYQVGRLVRGKAALREALQGLLPMNPTAAHEVSHVVESGDLALWTSQWTVRGTGPDGSPIVRTGRGCVVFRKGMDGGWRVAIENPWGGSVLDRTW